MSRWKWPRGGVNHPKSTPIASAKPYYHRAAFPERLGVPYFLVGDAQLKSNPAFGLGTSLTAISCLELRNAFSARPASDPLEAARRYAFACRRHLDTAWSLTMVTDGLYDRPEQERGLGRALLNFVLGRFRARFIGMPALARRVILSAQLVVHDRPWFDPRFAVPAGGTSAVFGMFGPTKRDSVESVYHPPESA
jgi:2-polyprenyl-6-methoxyphenol hydroxylase-like FAD-dependent oxidoreductase